jgi:ParB family chromosome partitioning protein
MSKEFKNCYRSYEIKQIKCDSIRPNRAQPRGDFDSASLEKLADSIKRYGVIQPLSIRKSDEGDYYEYELISGERRLRASRIAGIFTVPCIILEADSQISAEIAIIENLMRKDLNMFELAYGMRNLIEQHGLTQDELAKRMSMSQSAIANKIRLLRFSYDEQRLILECGLTERHARALLRLESAEERISTIERIVERSLTAEETEEYIDFLLFSPCDTETVGNDRLFEEFSADRSARSIIRGLKKKIDTLKKNGRSASMIVNERSDAIELTVRIDR